MKENLENQEVNSNKKLIIIGDIHGRSSWKIPAYNEKWDIFIFIGDYFDTMDGFTTIEQIHNFKEIVEFKKNSKNPVIILIGNHDHRYFPETRYDKISGYQGDGAAISIGHILNENREYLQMAYSHNNLLFTHAGVSETWIEKIIFYIGDLTKILPIDNIDKITNFINQLWQYKPWWFSYSAGIGDDWDIEGTGDTQGQTPIWIRPRSLMKASKNIKELGIIQIVGHTQQNQIDIKGKATGGKYYFIDTLGTSGEYLIYENEIFSTKSIK